MKKVIIVGSNHAGIAAAEQLLKNKNIALTIYERNATLSYLGCMSSLCLSQELATGSELFYTTPASLISRGANLHMNTTVLNIDYDKKIVEAKDTRGRLTLEAYDILIMATGSTPKTIESDVDHPIHTIKFFDDTQRIDDALDHHSIKEVVIIGAGLIGLETAVSANARHKHVTILEREDHILADYFDPWISDDILTLYKTAGIKIELNSELDTANYETTQSPYQQQLYIATIGVRPNTQLGMNALELSKDGAFRVNKHSQTSRADVYAVGDCASVYSNALQKDIYSPRASYALQSGTIAGRHINGEDAYILGTQSSVGSCLLGVNLFATGVNVKVAQEAGLTVKTIHHKDHINHDFINKDSHYKCIIIYEEASRRIVGAQIASVRDMSLLIHMFSLAIAKSSTIDEIKHLDIFYHPQFNKLDNTFDY